VLSEPFNTQFHPHSDVYLQGSLGSSDARRVMFDFDATTSWLAHILINTYLGYTVLALPECLRVSRLRLSCAFECSCLLRPIVPIRMSKEPFKISRKPLQMIPVWTQLQAVSSEYVLVSLIP
jgi:hypothetical protein